MDKEMANYKHAFEGLVELVKVSGNDGLIEAAEELNEIMAETAKQHSELEANEPSEQQKHNSSILQLAREANIRN